jgi:hypothetical protein
MNRHIEVMISRSPLAGAILAAALVTGSLASPANAAPPAVQGAAVVSVSSPALQADAAARPRNGTILVKRIYGGAGVLKIRNGTRKDAVVTLMKGRKKAISVYVRARSRATVKDVKDGTYTIFFTTGYRFRNSTDRFTRSASYQRFEKKLRFRTTSTQYTIWSLILNPVKNGNARTRLVNPRDYPA